MSLRPSRFRRSFATAGAAGLVLSLLAVTPVVAAEGSEDDLAARIGAIDAAERKQLETAQGQKATSRTPASSTRDFADGATRRTARIADVSSPNDGTVVRADLTQDLTAQRLRASITLKSGAADRLVAVYFGEFSGTRCLADVGMGGRVSANEASGTFIPDSRGGFAVSRTRSGSTLTLTSNALSRFRSAPYDCAYAAVADTAGTVVQSFYAEPLTTHFTPKLSITGGEPIQAARKGKWVTMRLNVRNSGKAKAANVRVTASGKGLKIKPKSRSLGTINDRSTKHGVVFKVRVAKKTKSRKVAFTVRGTGARAATKKFTIGVAPKPKKYKSLSGRYFWGFASNTAADTRGWDTQVIWFLNKKWAHFGAPKNGTVPKCRKVTKACKKYSYNRKKGIVKIAGKKAKVTTYGFRYQAKKDKSRLYEPATFPKKGQKFGTDLINQDWRGNCLIMCTATTTNLTFDKKNRFVRGSWSVGSWPGLGSSWASIPPDQRGTYRVISKGRIELRFASGKVERTRIALLHNALNKPSATSGIVLGTKNFYFQD